MDTRSLEEIQPPPSMLAAGHRSLRRRWLYLLPVVFVTYSLAYLDRANFGFGAAAGLAATLHITGQQTSLLGSLFFLGYLLFQMPGAIFAKKRSATRLVFFALIAWGALAALSGVIQIFWLLALDRFLLGVAESMIFPAMLVLLTRWFTRAERSRANTVLILGNPVTVLWMSAITGYLIQAFGWQKTFIIEGLPSVLWAGIWILLVRDRPSKAKWMTPESVEALETEIAREQLTVPPVGAVRQALLRGDVLLISMAFFFWSVGLYGFVLWLPTMVQQGSSLSMGKTGLLSALPYLLAIAMMLVVSHFSDRMQKRQVFVWPLLCLSGIALLGSFLTAAYSFPLAFVCLVLAGGCMYAPYGPFWAMIPERVPANVTAEVLAYINTFGACGALFGSYFVGLLRALTGNSRAGYLLMALALVCSGLILFTLRKPLVVAPAAHSKVH